MLREVIMQRTTPDLDGYYEKTLRRTLEAYRALNEGCGSARQLEFLETKLANLKNALENRKAATALAIPASA